MSPQPGGNRLLPLELIVEASTISDAHHRMGKERVLLQSIDRKGWRRSAQSEFLMTFREPIALQTRGNEPKRSRLADERHVVR